MSRFTRIFEMLDIIFGKGFMSKNIGKRTNVITLPDENSRRLLTKELAIDKAPDSAIQQGKKDLEKLALDIPKLNDQELLTLTNNAERLAARINPKEFIKRRQRALPKADVIEFANKEKISPEGVMSLTEKIGQKNAPGTLMGNLESRIKQLEASGEDLSKLKGKTYDEIMGDVASSQQGMRQLEKQGLVRATARDIITNDIKSGKLKLPKELEQQILEGGGEPIDVLRNVYGEDALEVLDSLIPEFSKLRTSTEAEKLARSKFKFEPDVNRPKGSMSLEEAKKAEQENILTPKKPEEPEEFANGGRVGFMDGGSKGLDYLTGVDRKGYADGSNYEFIKTLPKSLSDAINKFGFDAVIGKTVESGGGNAPGEYIPGKYTPYYSLMEADSGGGTGLKDEYLRILEAGPPKSTPAPAPAEQLQTTYTANVTPSTSSGLYPNNPFYSSTFGVPTESVQPKTSKLYPNNPFYSSTFGVPTEEDTSKEMSSDISVLYDQYMKNLGYQSGGRVGYSDGTKPSAEENTPSQEIINRMIAQIKQLSKRGVDVNTIKDIVGASDQMIKDVLGKASGGSMSKGLDYLTGIERRGYADGNIVSGLAIRLNRPVQPGDPIGSYYGGTPIMISNKKVEPTLNRDSQGRLVNSITGKPITTSIFLPLNRELMSSPSKPSMTLRDKLRPLSLNERLQFFATNKPSYDEFYDLLQMNLKGEDRQQAADGGSQGLDYLMGIERRGYANGDYVVQAGIKNYLGKQKTATVPIKWKSGKGDSHPDTELAYITKPEKDLLLKLDMHNSMPDGEPNIGPGGLISLNSGGDGGAGGGGGGDGGSTDTGDQGSEAANDAASASAAASASGSSGTDTADMGSEAANVSSTSSGAASVGSGSSGTDTATDTADMGSEAANVSSTSSGAASVGAGDSGGPTDTADMGSEAANVSSTQSGAASVGAGDSGGPTDTADLGTEAANDAATAAAAASVGMGTLSSYSRPGMVATNISNYMRGNPMTSLGLTALGTMIGMPGLGVMNAANSVYGGGSSGSSTGSGQGEDGSGDEEDGRTFIPSFDTALLTPSLLDSYNLAKNRDYRLFQSSNNPFYSLQRNPSGGINNVYTEFKKGGRVRMAGGGSMSKGLDYLSGVERRGYVGGGFGSGLVDPMEAMYVNTFGFNPFPKYGFNSYMDYNTARITGTPMNQNISDLEDYLGTLESAREINLPGVTKDLSAEDISRLQEEYVKKMAKTSNALNPTVTASTAASTPDYRQQALSEMLSRYNVSSLGDIKNFNYLIPGYKDKNNLEVRAFETRIPDLAVSRRAQQLEDAAIRAQQDQEAYKNRISQVDPNALRNNYLQNLQNTSSQSIDQFQSKLRSNLVPRGNEPQGLNYLTGN
jgi:hypothetical protein